MLIGTQVYNRLPVMPAPPSDTRPDHDAAIDVAWAIVLATSGAAEAADAANVTRSFAMTRRMAF